MAGCNSLKYLQQMNMWFHLLAWNFFLSFCISHNWNCSERAALNCMRMCRPNVYSPLFWVTYTWLCFFVVICCVDHAIVRNLERNDTTGLVVCRASVVLYAVRREPLMWLFRGFIYFGGGINLEIFGRRCGLFLLLAVYFGFMSSTGVESIGTACSL